MFATNKFLKMSVICAVIVICVLGFSIFSSEAEDITLRGYIQQNNQILATVTYSGQSHYLFIGDNIAGYKFTGKHIGQLIFEKDDAIYAVSVGGAIGKPAVVQDGTVEASDYIDNIEKNLRVHFIDVGQGDAVLIQHKNTNVLIDGGDRWDWVADKLTSYLREQGVERLDAVVGTHPHADHIGGLTAVIESFPVKTIYDSGRVHTTQTYENYLELIDKKNIPFYTPRRGDLIEIGELAFQVLHPAGDVERYSLNDASVVLRLNYGEISFLFTGDAELRAEREMVDARLILAASVLKVGHHGSRTSTNEFFLIEVDPKIAIIQTGEDNRYKHPHAEVIELLESRGIDIYRTDIHGNVVISTDGKSYRVYTETDQARAPPTVEKKTNEGRLNINTAEATALESLWGVGPVIAERIIKYREDYGPFESIEEIMNVDGIDEEKFNLWHEEIKI